MRMQLFSRLMPREGKFFDLFNQHSALVVKGGAALADLLRAYDDEAYSRHAHCPDR